MKNGLINDEYSKIWYKDDKFHREDGPAVELVDGTKKWYQNDHLHRIDGPAVEHPNGEKVWHFRGIHVKCSSQKEFEDVIQVISLPIKVDQSVVLNLTPWLPIKISEEYKISVNKIQIDYLNNNITCAIKVFFDEKSFPLSILDKSLFLNEMKIIMLYLANNNKVPKLEWNNLNYSSSNNILYVGYLNLEIKNQVYE